MNLENFLKPVNLSHEYIRKFELITPVFKSHNVEIDKFYKRLSSFQSNLQQSIYQIRISKDIKGSMAWIRSNLDSLLECNNETMIESLTNKIFLETGTFMTKSNGSSSIPAQELVRDFFKLIGIISNFTSKTFHSISRKNSSGQKDYFEFNSEYEDIEYILTLSLSLTNYIIKKMNRII